MTDTPFANAPLDAKEQPILDSLLQIRDDLALLKADRSTYIRSNDIITSYDQLIEQVHKLNSIRKEDGKPREQNRGVSPARDRLWDMLMLSAVDTVLDDCFQLISLGFMTIGRNKEAPAAYGTTSQGSASTNARHADMPLLRP